MLLSVLLLLLVCGSQAVHYYGTVMTYYPKDMTTNGSVLVNVRYKLSFVACTANDTWSCSGNCGSETADVELNVVDESPGEWCQREGVMTRLVSGTAPFQLLLHGGNWITGIMNSIVSRRAVSDVELSFRSDSNQINTSPVTTILPALRIPSNCQRNISLLAFDPDGDEVKCRNGVTSAAECNPCTPPSVLNLSSFCTLSFSPTNSSSEGPYAVQLVMEDFPRQNLNLVQPDGSLVQKTTNEAISKIPVQFVLKVDPAVPSCSEGVYLPRFLSPTPDHGAQILTTVNQTVEISIRAEATQSTISGLLFSGPHNVVKNSQALGNFTLTWTPSNSESGEIHPICFVVQSSLASSVYQSDLRCVTVKVGNPVPTTTTKPQTTMPPVPTTTIQFPTTTVVFPTTVPTTTPPAPTSTVSPATTATVGTTTTTVVVPTVPPVMPPSPQINASTTTTYPQTTMPPVPTTTIQFPTTTDVFPTTVPTTTHLPTTTTVVFPTVPPVMPPSPQTSAPTTMTYPQTTVPPVPTTTIQFPTTTDVFPTTVPTTTHLPTTTTVVVPTVPPVMPPSPQTSAPTTPPPTSTSDPGPYYVIALNAKISTTLSLENDNNTIIQLIKNELTNKGLPQNIIVTIRRKGALETTTAAP